MTQAVSVWSTAPSNVMTSGFKGAYRSWRSGLPRRTQRPASRWPVELANAKDIQGVITLQSRYAQTQLQSYARQAQELGRLMAEAMRSMKPKS